MKIKIRNRKYRRWWYGYCYSCVPSDGGRGAGHMVYQKTNKMTCGCGGKVQLYPHRLGERVA